MEEYESIMKLNVVRPVTVTGVTRTTMGTYLVETDCLLGGAPARWECRAVISGTFWVFYFSRVLAWWHGLLMFFGKRRGGGVVVRLFSHFGGLAGYVM